MASTVMTTTVARPIAPPGVTRHRRDLTDGASVDRLVRRSAAAAGTAAPARSDCSVAMALTYPPPRGAGRAGLEADPGIEPAGQQVDHQVHADDQPRQDDDERLHQGNIAIVRRLDGQAAHARVGEDGFDHDRATEQEPGLEPDERQRREGGVLQRMPAHHRAAGEPLALRRADEVPAQRLDQRGAEQPGDRRGGVGGQGDGGEDQRLDAIAARGRQPAQMDGKGDDQERAEPEPRNRLPEQGKPGREQIDQPAGASASRHAERNADHERQGQRHLPPATGSPAAGRAQR